MVPNERLGHYLSIDSQKLAASPPFLLARSGSPAAKGLTLILLPRGLGGREKLSNDMSNNISSMKYSLKSLPGLADVKVPHGDGDGPRAPPRCPGGLETISNN